MRPGSCVRAKTKRRSIVLVATIGVFVLAAFVWSRLPAQSGDAGYRPALTLSRIPASLPRVLIDSAHVNLHTVDGRYAPFSRLAQAAGFRVEDVSGWMQPDALGPSDVLVVANALGISGAADQLGAVLGLDRWVNLTRSAFGDEEITRLEMWVRNGGSLLLIADHRPIGGANARLARVFSVEMTNGYVEDPDHHETTANVPSFLVFDRTSGLLGEHPILEGRDPSERVNRVITFTGQALRADAGVATLLRLAPSAMERNGRSAAAQGRSVAGLAQAVALEHGKGRVIVLGEAAVATSQVVGPPGSNRRMGLQWPATDNERFIVNALYWLSRAL
jgi:hypothetical protein